MVDTVWSVVRGKAETETLPTVVLDDRELSTATVDEGNAGPTSRTGVDDGDHQPCRTSRRRCRRPPFTESNDAPTRLLLPQQHV